MKKTTKTTVNEYDEKGKLIKSIETIVEEEIKEDKHIPHVPPTKIPSITPNPYSTTPQVGDCPTGIYTNTGIDEDLTITLGINNFRID